MIKTIKQLVTAGEASHALTVAYKEGLAGHRTAPSGGRIVKGAIDCDEEAAFFEGKQERLMRHRRAVACGNHWGSVGEEE